MKKAIIAGAASAVLAAMPMAGVFAAQATISITDKLSTTVNTACAFTRTGTAGEQSQTGVTSGPSWTNTTGTALGTYSVTLNPGANATLGTSSFTAYCNANGGYTVTVATPDMATTANDKIEFSGEALTAGEGEGWTLQKRDNSYIAQTGATFMSNQNSTESSNPDTETATYKVYTLTTTEAGTYVGDVVYTFTYEDANATGA